ncbi:flagellar basal body P-ring protein FlgI, partial [Sinorhizobium meliloti]
MVAALLPAFGGQALALSRVKDLASIEGVRQNQLVGYGIVVGLNGTGDTLNNIPFTKQSLQAMLERLGVNTRGATMRTQNLAAVMVTASLPPFATQGNRIDITVSSLGDAKSLQGGTLLVTPLLGA